MISLLLALQNAEHAQSGVSCLDAMPSAYRFHD